MVAFRSLEHCTHPTQVWQSAAGLIEKVCATLDKTELHCAQLVFINNYHIVCATGKA